MTVVKLIIAVVRCVTGVRLLVGVPGQQWHVWNTYKIGSVEVPGWTGL